MDAAHSGGAADRRAFGADLRRHGDAALNEYRRGHRWRAYRDYLSKVARGREPSTGVAVSNVLPIAIALGLAGAWAKFLKMQRLAAPGWFHALPSGGDNGAFARSSLTAARAPGARHGGGAGAGGAAGGGASAR